MPGMEKYSQLRLDRLTGADKLIDDTGKHQIVIGLVTLFSLLLLDMKHWPFLQVKEADGMKGYMEKLC